MIDKLIDQWKQWEQAVTMVLVVLACLGAWYFMWNIVWWAWDQYKEVTRVEKELSQVKGLVQYMDKMTIEDSQGTTIITFREE